MAAGDNPRSHPPRLYEVAGADAWEDEVRRCLTDRAAGVRPSGADLAGTAIARTRRARRRRTVVGLAAIMGGTMLAAGVLLQGWHAPERTSYGPVTGVLEVAPPTPTPAVPPRLASDPEIARALSVGVVGEAEGGGVALATGDGRTLDLGGVDELVSAHRVPGGWAVVSGQPGFTRLWWVAAGQDPVPVLSGMDAIAVDRGRVAWRRGGLLAAAELSAGGERISQASTVAPAADARPVGFLGDAVLLQRTDPSGWDAWRPADGDYRASWNPEVLRVYGALPDGQGAVGLVPPAAAGSAHPCLARLDVAPRLPRTKLGCPAGGLAVDAPAALSPDGRWLLTAGSGGDPEADRSAVVVDLAAAFGADPAAAVVEVPDVPAPTGQPVWAAADQALFPTADRLVRVWPERLRAGEPDAVELVALSGAPPLLVRPV